MSKGKIPKAGPKSHQWKAKKRRQRAEPERHEKPGLSKWRPLYEPGDPVTNGYTTGKVISVHRTKLTTKGDARKGWWMRWYFVEGPDGMMYCWEEMTMGDA